MHRSMKQPRTFALAGALMFALAAPVAASADDSVVSGTVGSELSVSAPDSPLTAFSPATDGTGSTNVTVSSTGAWSLALSDATVLTPGQMDKVDCATGSPTSGSLATALAYSAPDGSGSISAGSAVVETGVSVQDVAVSYTQAIGATEDLVADDCYRATVTYTAT